MKKNVPFLMLLTITSLLCTSCNFNNKTYNNDTNLRPPGKDRVWWYEDFDNSAEVQEFVIKLKNTKKNTDFNFGISEFKVPSVYEHFSTKFSGHIKTCCSREEDIFNSTYDDFWIETNFVIDTTILPIQNSYDTMFDIYFYPFYLSDNTFENKKISYESIDYFGGAYDITFSYGESKIMKAIVACKSSSYIDKEQMIDELITNYKLIV